MKFCISLHRIRMLTMVSILLLLFISMPVYAIEWDKILGGGQEPGVANSIIQTKDGGYAVAGYTVTRITGEDVWVTKLDESGEVEWDIKVDKTSGKYKYNDVAKSIIQTTDGGYAVVGYTRTVFPIKGNIEIIKLDKKGNIEWDNILPCKGFYNKANSIIQTDDGGYAVAGAIEANSGDIWIIKLSEKGNLEWDKVFGGFYYDEANSIIQTDDGGYAVAGTNAQIIKLSEKGNLEWNKVFGGDKTATANSIIQTTDGGYAVAGRIEAEFPERDDVFIIKLDKKGNIEWDKFFGGDEDDSAYSIIQASDGGYAVAGQTASKGVGEADVWVIKLDGKGNLEWDETFGGNSYDRAYSIIQTNDGGYAVAGHRAGDAWVIKLKEQ